MSDRIGSIINQYKQLVESIKNSKENNTSTLIKNNREIAVIIGQLIYYDFDVALVIVNDLKEKSYNLNISLTSIISIVFTQNIKSESLFLLFFEKTHYFDMFFMEFKLDPSIKYLLEMCKNNSKQVYEISDSWRYMVSILTIFCEISNYYMLDKGLLILSESIDSYLFYIIIIKLINLIKKKSIIINNKKMKLLEDSSIVEIIKKYIDIFTSEYKKNILLAMNYDKNESDIYMVLEELCQDLKNNNTKIIEMFDKLIKKDENISIKLLVKILSNLEVSELKFIDFKKIKKFYYLINKYADFRNIFFLKIPFKYLYIPFNPNKEISINNISDLKEMIEMRLLNKDPDFEFFFNFILNKVKCKNERFYDLFFCYINSDTTFFDKIQIKYCESRLEFDRKFKNHEWFKKFYMNINNNVDMFVKNILEQKDYSLDRMLFQNYGWSICHLLKIVTKIDFIDSINYFSKILLINFKKYEDFFIILL